MRPIPTRAVAVVACVASVAAVIGVTASAAPARADCDGALVTDVRHGVEVCLHASERPPPGVDLKRRPSSDELKERRFGKTKQPPSVAGTDGGGTFQAAGGTVACLGDGAAGNRVQAIYARAADIPDRFSSIAGLIRQYAADADYQINVSAGQSNAGRRVRFVTDSCVLSIASVVLGTAADDSFTTMRSELQAKGFNKPDRKYLVWMDASVGICGLGELYNDDRDTPENANNRGPAYARVDAPCWGYAEAHELLHTLGAVQGSAPHSTSAGHCVDENDTMCYTDTSGSAMSNACPGLPSWQVDCSLDDYFNAGSPGSGYLATHWNVADSTFLEPDAAPPPPPTVSVTAPASFYAGNPVGVVAAVGVPAGRGYTVTWASSRTDCKFTAARGLSNAYYCPVTAAGSGQVTARVTDSLGMTNISTRSYQLVIPSRQRATSAALSRSPSTIQRGRVARLAGKLVDRITGKAIIGMRVTVYYRTAGSRTWRVAATRTTGPSGTWSLNVRPSRTTYYMFQSWYTRTWASTRSPSRTVGVR